MRTTTFEDITTSVLGFGCGSVMGRVGRNDSLRAMNAAWDAGITLFDTARSYGYGEAETLLGEFLTGKRERAIVVTKFGIWPAAESRWKRMAKPLVRVALRAAPRARGLVRRAIAGEMTARPFEASMVRASLEVSLRQLRTDYVDVLLMHEAPASAMAQDDLMVELEAVIREGKVRRAGLSFTPGAAAEAMARGPAVMGAVQFPANLYTLDGLPQADGKHFVMVNHPFGGEARVQAATQALAAMSVDPSVDIALREKLRGNPKARLAQLVVPAVLQATGAHVVVPSMLRLEHLRANVAAVDAADFTQDEMELLRGRILIDSRRTETGERERPR